MTSRHRSAWKLPMALRCELFGRTPLASSILAHII